jgi:putative nucleotidyltransferase with HDIG domain
MGSESRLASFQLNDPVKLTDPTQPTTYMASGSPRRTRADRVANLNLPPGRIAATIALFRRGDVLARYGMCLIAAMCIWCSTGAWLPPFSFRLGYVPNRDITARVEFQVADEIGKRNAVDQAERSIVCIYKHDPKPLNEFQQALKNQVFEVVGAEQYSRESWIPFAPGNTGNTGNTGSTEGTLPSDTEMQESWTTFREVLTKDEGLAQFELAVKQAFVEFQQHGLLTKLEHELGHGSQTEIFVHPVGNETFVKRFLVDKVQVANAASRLEKLLSESFKNVYTGGGEADIVTRHIVAWIKPQLPRTTTLTLDVKATGQAKKEAGGKVEPVMRTYVSGEKLVEADRAISPPDLKLLRSEYFANIGKLSFYQVVIYSLADLGMFVALYTLCGYYVARREPDLLFDLRRLGALLGLVVICIVTSYWLSAGGMGAEIGPLVFFGMIVAIAYHQELSLILSAATSLAAVFSLGQGLSEYVIYVATVSAAIFMLNHIRSRTKLIYVSLWTAAVCFATAMGVSVLSGQPIDLPLLQYATMLAVSTLITGLLLTAFLPFMERLFDVHTDIRLLELGDVAHPLLQELVRRAPGTYNHSINVASIGEAAADSIGANSLLVRVGAYFHDIGKMLKPQYFVENQGESGNRHDSLVPAMSTLVIIAHVKDGADLARQHKLPEPIIDFIEQHHGTTLVEYFYRQATRQSESDPDSPAVDETNFRYPGPKPQTKEAGVLMLADAVESASRTLVDPAPSRIENFVHEIVMKKLMDGQFDECGITLQEINTIEDSLVKSLTAVYHGRVKYPDQQTA